MGAGTAAALNPYPRWHDDGVTGSNPRSDRPEAGPFDLAAIGTGLPFADSLAELADVLRRRDRTAVVQAPPGTGKTTLVPPLVANLVAGKENRVIVTQPRRVAVRAAARRLASLDVSPIGERVGFAVRGEQHPGSLVEFVTPGVLLRRLLADPDLAGVSAVVLDEVHERGLDTDLLLGMLTEVHALRDDLTLVAMSATLEATRFASLLGNPADPAPIVDCPSALHPLEVRWEPAPGLRLDDRGVTPDFLDHVAGRTATAHATALAADDQTDALVFLPGAREVSQVASRLRASTTAEVLELHGQVDPAEQDRAVSGRRPGDPPRIIVSTALAESSLTVPGVRLVVDAGLAREPRRDSARQMTGLVTVTASRATAEQRAGRAARLGPGTVVRCYDRDTHRTAPAQPTPEVAVADLTGAALTLACWGAPGGADLRLPDPLPGPALADALAALRRIGAVDADGRATELGTLLARLPADPRLGRALLDGSSLLRAAGQDPALAARTVAMVEDEARAPGADLGRLLTQLNSGRAAGSRRWRRQADRLASLARGTDDVPGSDRSLELDRDSAIGLVVALAFPERIARRTGDTFLLAQRTRAGLPAGSPLAGQEWLAVAEVSRAGGRDAAGTGALIRAAAPLDEATALLAGEHLLSDEVTATVTGGRIVARRERRLGAIVLESTPVRPNPEQGRVAVERAIVTQGLGLFTWSEGADTLRRRLALLHRELGDPWPAMDEESLLARLPEWLGPEIDELAREVQVKRGAATRSIGLNEPLRRLLPWPAATELDALAPERLRVPSGNRVRIDYPPLDEPGGRPVVAVKLQECFGWADTPRLAGGRVPVLFHLLSPAGRPLAVTDDLASFWSGPYAQVRAEMRGRYPKHPWPEDPWTAPATARTKKRM